MTGPAAARLVVIGGSWGAIEPLCTLLRRLGPDFPLPVVVAVHRSGRSVDGMLEQLLRQRTGMLVEPVEDKSTLVPGTVHLAPADYHLLVDGAKLELSLEAPERYSRPSIDVLFGSAAESHAGGVVAVLLSGASDDGARGAEQVRDYGGRVLVQSPEEAERSEMPSAAIALGAFDEVGPIDRIADALVAVAGAGSR